MDFNVDANTYGKWAETEEHVIPDSANVTQAVKAAKRLVQAHLAKCVVPERIEAAAVEATYEQTAFWLTNGINPQSEGVQSGQVVASAALLGGSITYADTAQTAENRVKATEGLCHQARLILQLAGARPRVPGVVG